MFPVKPEGMYFPTFARSGALRMGHPVGNGRRWERRREKQIPPLPTPASKLAGDPGRS